MASSIIFFIEGTPFTIKNKIKLRRWILQVIKQEKKNPGELNFIFCSDDYLLSINQQYLKHDAYTDIITFNTSSTPVLISGDIFISVERVRENAGSLNLSVTDELHRVIIHGVLHLIGYADKKPAQKKEMTSKEDIYLSSRSF